MSRLLVLCCRREQPRDMGAALSQPQDGAPCGPQPAPTTMAEVIRERKKKAGGAGLATLRRRLAAAAARRPRSDMRGDRGSRGGEHARWVRQLVSSWRPAEVAALHEEYEAAAALRDLITQAELAREPAPTLQADLAQLYADRWCGDAELVYRGAVFPVHRAVLSARCPYFRDLLNSYPSVGARICLDGMPAYLTPEDLDAVLRALYAGDEPPPPDCCAEGEGTGWCSCPRMSTCPACTKSASSGADCCSRAHLDILNAERAGSWKRRACSCRRVDAARLRRTAEEFGFRLDSLQRDLRYLLDSGDYSDASLVFSYEGNSNNAAGANCSGSVGSAGSGSSSAGRSGSDYGFRPKLELACHKAVLCARSPFFRSVVERRERAGGGAGGAAPDGRRGWCPPGVLRLCVDERVLPRRFARALLHAAYTDQVDLSLVSRGTSSPQGGCGAAPGTAWGAGGRSGNAAAGSKSSTPRQNTTLDDACQLYEIARFLEMSIVVQGCEDAIVEALSGETLPRILEWSRAAHASKWVHRQAMRYLRDEFATLASGAAPIQHLPRAALADALASPFLQASETQALRALLRWGERAAQARAEEREPNVVWHTAHSVSRKGARRRDASDAELREVIAPLVPLLRTEHALPQDSDVLQQAIRRGLVPTPPHQMVEGGSSADAWLGRGPYRPPRLFLPYYDEIKALLEDQLVAEADVSRVRRARYIHHIPDTLYMLCAERGAEETETPAESGPVTAPPPRVMRALCARARELRAAPPAARALRHPTADHNQIQRQICLRAVREFGLPDSCAELVSEEGEAAGAGGELRPPSRQGDTLPDTTRKAAACRYARSELSWDDGCSSDEECRCHRSRDESECEAARSRPAGGAHTGRAPAREGEVRRGAPGEAPGAAVLPALVVEGQPGHLPARYGEAEASGAGAAGRLSEAVPDVAMCRAGVPNANTHLLSGRDYFRAVFTPRAEYGGGGMLQLDLGDGATHTPPRHGSRAQRAAAAAPGAPPAAPRARPPAPAHPRDLDPQATCSLSLQRRPAGTPAQPSHDEIRAALELSVIQAYSSFHPRSLSPSIGHPLLSGHRPPSYAHQSATLPHSYSATGNHAQHSSNAGLHLANSGILSGNAGILSGNTGILGGNSGILSSALHSTNSSLHSVGSFRSGSPNTINLGRNTPNHLSESNGHLSSNSNLLSGHISSASSHISNSANILSSDHISRSSHSDRSILSSASPNGHHSSASGHLSNKSGHISNASGHLSNASGHISNVSGHVSNVSGHNSNTSAHLGSSHVSNVSGINPNTSHLGNVANVSGHNISNVSGHVMSSTSGGHGTGGHRDSLHRSVSPRHATRDRLREYAHFRPPPDFRLEGGYGGTRSSSRGHSPSNYS